jgi:CHAT domain-containing protein/Tfp pilus assembly protein PilF
VIHIKNRPGLSWPRGLAIIASLAFTYLSSLAQSPLPQPPEIEPGKQIESELKAGQTNAYKLNLVAGQFIHVVVDQKGIDVKVNLLAPDGSTIISIDGPNGPNGPEEMAIIASSSGEHSLAVVSDSQTDPPGNYRITVVSLRSPTDVDRQRVAAESAFVEAYMKLRPQGTAVARRSAIEKMKSAMPFFRSVGEWYRLGWITQTMALFYAQLGEFRTASEHTNTALQLARSANDIGGEAFALNLLGGMADVLGDPQGALVYYSQALSAARAAGLLSVQGSILNNIGKINYDLADWQKAIEYYNQALPFTRTSSNRRSEAITLHNIGVAYAVSGDEDKALAMFDQALPIRRAAADKAGEADTLTSIGWILNSSGRSEEALKYFEQAMPLRLMVGDRRGEAITLDHLGVTHATMGQLTKALEYHEKALERHRTAESPRTEATCLANIGYVQNLLLQPQKSLESYEKALTIFIRLGDRQNEARALEGIARVERDLGSFSQAQVHLEKALDLIESVRSTAGAQQARSAYFASRQGAYELYIDLLMQLHRKDPSAGFDAKALQTSERMRARSLVDLLTQAQVDIRKGVDTALIAREHKLGDTLNAKAQRQIQIRAQKAGSAEELARLEKEVGLLEIEYQQVKASIRDASPAYAALTQPQALTVNEMQDQLDPDTLLLEYALGEKRSYVWAVSKGGLNSYELPGRQQIQQSARKVYELLTARASDKHGESANQRGIRLAAADVELLRSASDLSQIVIAPVRRELSGDRIVVVADGALQYIPFSILPVDASRAAAQYRPLVADHEIISLPSISALAVHRKTLASRQPGINAIAMIADPVFSADDVRVTRGTAVEPLSDGGATTRQLEHVDGTFAKMAINRLRFTRNEADRILAILPASSNVSALDFKANRAAVTSGDLGRYRYVHFATHGYLDSARPDLSALVLSLVDKDGKPEDGFLRAHDIYNLDLPVELVVLSACQTGLGKEIKGEGLVGLTRGFMYAGAKRVVVSLWSVNDKATADLMTDFYRGMLKNHERPAAALRAAQIEMWKQKKWQSPYYWAGFTMQGEWR